MDKAIHYNSSLGHFLKYVLVGLIGATFLTCSVLISSNILATSDSVVDEINITVPISCSLTGTGMNTHNAEIPNGTYQSNIGNTTLKAFCNDNEGFAIYAAGYTGNEIGGTNSNKLVGTNASSNATIVTGTAISAGNPDISNWAMKLGTESSAAYALTLDNSYDSYNNVPSTYTKVAHRDSSTDIGDNAVGAELTTTYAAYISKTQSAGTYTGQVKYTLVHPASETPLSPQQATAGCINYFANASNAVGTMGCQSATDGNDIDLLASNFSRTGYGFAGWSNKYDYATNTDSDLKFYGPQETITVPTGTTANGLSLYAVWIKSEGSIQDTSKVIALCGTNGVGGTLTTAPTDGTADLSSVSALTDQRDNQTYAIARLADGRCWMIENLRLESTNSDNSTGALAQGYNSSFVGLATAESTNFNDTTTANSLYSTTGSTEITISGDGRNHRFPRYNNLNTQSRAQDNPSNNTFVNDNTTGGMYSYGNYYTWPAAIADTTRYDDGDHGTTSLCPTGWRLPIGNKTTVDKSFGALSVALGGPEGGTTANSRTTPTGTAMSSIFRSYPNNYLYSGSFHTSTADNRGVNGGYWSSTMLSNSYRNYAHTLYFGSSSVYPGTQDILKFYGFSIRCTVNI